MASPSEKIAQVQGIVAAGRRKVSGVFWKTDSIARLENQLNVIGPMVTSWASRGKTASAASTAPKEGWTSWNDLGKTYAVEIQNLIDGSNVIWPALTDTVAKIPENIPKDLANAAKGTAAVVGDVAGAVTKPLLPIVIVAAVVAVAVVVGLVVYKK